MFFLPFLLVIFKTIIIIMILNIIIIFEYIFICNQYLKLNSDHWSKGRVGRRDERVGHGATITVFIIITIPNFKYH